MPKMHSLNNSQVLMPHWFTIWDDCYPWSNLNQLKRRSRRIGVFLGSHLLNNIPVAKKKVYSPTTWVRTRWKIVALQQVARFARCFWVSVAPCIGCISRHQISNKISIKKTCSFNYTWSLCSKKDVQRNPHPPFQLWLQGESWGLPRGFLLRLQVCDGLECQHWGHSLVISARYRRVEFFAPVSRWDLCHFSGLAVFQLMAPVNPRICWCWPLTKTTVGMNPQELSHVALGALSNTKWNVKKDPVWGV